MIFDNLCVHHARAFEEWLSEHEDEIQIFYLPAYSPELNPDAYFNCDLKAGAHSGKPVRAKASLKKRVVSHIRMLQKKPAGLALVLCARK